MNSKTLTSLVIGVVIIILVIFLAMKGNAPQKSATDSDDTSPVASSTVTIDTNTASSTTSATSSSSSTSSSTSAGKTYTAIEVATHNSVASCWAIVNGSVYDLTKWINQHPGGKQAILKLCGKDGTTAFENQHDSQQAPNQALASFKIGILAQ